MGSEPSPPPDAGAAAAPAPDFGGSLAGRVRPRQRTVRVVATQATSSLIHRAVRFGRVLGLSSMRRWYVEAADGSDVEHLGVRPPIDYWPWPDDDGGLDIVTGGPTAPAQIARA